ncbi:S8 family serine peptidase [Spirulina major CS-329]|nr:S8 family serine peptidase [Spirulina major CS-329]
MPKSPQSPSPFHAFILEPILTPSAIADSPFDEQPDFDDVNVDDLLDHLEGDRAPDSLNFDPADVEILPFASPSESNYTGGEFTVGADGTVGIDFLFDGGAYRRGEVGIFSLEGLDPDSENFTQLAAERALSNSEQGHVVISDATDGARFSGTMREADFNAGKYQGVREFEMKAGDRFGIMLASNHSIEDVANGKIENVRFSMSRPDSAMQFGQIADVTGDGNTFAFEDVTLDQSDQDYNDIVFQVRGATAETALMDEMVAEGRDWRTQNMGQALIEYANAYTDNVDYTAADFEAAREFQPLVGVIDTGVDADAIGLDADAILTGSDFIDGDDNSLLTDGEGDEHGTQVVSLINTINDDAPLWVGRSVGSGQWASSLVEFVDAAVESEQPNAVVNLSFDLTQIDADGNITTRDEFTPMEMAALEYARQNDVLVVAASGNQGALMSALGQASEQFDNIITVGAAEQIDPNASNWQGYDRASYSSYGKGLDLMAHGGNGSSMAAAQVTGAISQLWAANPDLSYQQAIAILKQTATDLGEANPDLETGAGLLNVAAAVHLAKTMKAEDYEKDLQYVPLTWSGEDEFTPMERAANPDAATVAAVISTTWESFVSRFRSTSSSGFSNFLRRIFDRFYNSVAPVTQTFDIPDGRQVRNVSGGSSEFNFSLESAQSRVQFALAGDGFTQDDFTVELLKDGVVVETKAPDSGNYVSFSDVAKGNYTLRVKVKSAKGSQSYQAVVNLDQAGNDLSRTDSDGLDPYDLGNIAGQRKVLNDFVSFKNPEFVDKDTYKFWTDSEFRKLKLSILNENGNVVDKLAGDVQIVLYDKYYNVLKIIDSSNQNAVSAEYLLSPDSPYYARVSSKSGEQTNYQLSLDVQEEEKRPRSFDIKPQEGSINGSETKHFGLNFFPGQEWETKPGYKLAFQGDGNLVMYNADDEPIWATGTAGSGANKLSIQGDGNVVLYKDDSPLWATDTYGNDGAYFAVQGDGNLVVYSQAGQVLFKTGVNSGVLNASEKWLGEHFSNPKFDVFVNWAKSQTQPIKRLDRNDLAGQCVSLIARYIQDVYLPESERYKLRSFGHGYATASVVASQFPQYFSAYTTTGGLASNPPKQGAVISFGKYSPKFDGTYGHVGIVTSYNPTTKTVKYIDIGLGLSGGVVAGERSISATDYRINGWTNPK